LVYSFYFLKKLSEERERLKFIYYNIFKNHGKKVLTLDLIANYFINLQKTKLNKKFNSFGEYVDNLKEKGYRFL
jgi:hypothetical protein